jgi:hypothetical protein
MLTAEEDLRLWAPACATKDGEPTHPPVPHRQHSAPQCSQGCLLAPHMPPASPMLAPTRLAPTANRVSNPEPTLARCPLIG